MLPLLEMDEEPNGINDSKGEWAKHERKREDWEKMKTNDKHRKAYTWHLPLLLTLLFAHTLSPEDQQQQRQHHFQDSTSPNIVNVEKQC